MENRFSVSFECRVGSGLNRAHIVERTDHMDGNSMWSRHYFNINIFVDWRNRPFDAENAPFERGNRNAKVGIIAGIIISRSGNLVQRK